LSLESTGIFNVFLVFSETPHIKHVQVASSCHHTVLKYFQCLIPLSRSLPERKSQVFPGYMSSNWYVCLVIPTHILTHTHTHTHTHIFFPKVAEPKSLSFEHWPRSNSSVLFQLFSFILSQWNLKIFSFLSIFSSLGIFQGQRET
jgi:hypothetical protein